MADEVKAPMGDSNTTELYTDGICQIHLVNGAIKIDLLKICPNGTDKPDVHVKQRLIMTLQQFLSSADVVNNMINQLVKSGVISQDQK